MSMFGKLIGKMRVQDDEDDEDYLDDEEEYEEEPKPKRLFGKRNADDLDADDEPEQPRPNLFNRSKVTPVAKKKNSDICLVTPRSYDDAKEIVDDLLSNKSVVLRMEGLNTEVAQRIIDFTIGACYSINGKLQRISTYIFIITPETTNFNGDVADAISSTNTTDISGLNMRV